MKKVLAWLLVLSLTAAVSIGATLAYLTDTDEDVNVMTLGKVKIDQLEYERVDPETENGEADVQEFHDNKPLYPAVTEDGFDYTPGDSFVDWEQIGKDGYTSEIWDPAKINNELDKMVFVKNKGDYDAYVRSVFAFEANGYTFEEFQELFHLNINETDWTWEWAQEPVEISDKEGTTTTNYFIATATYNKVLKPGELTEISLSQIALDPKADNADVAGFGDTYQVLVKSQGIQADGFDGHDAALDEGFGTVIENTGTAESPLFTVMRSNLPFANDSAIKGIDLRTALHNLDGNTANPITAKVTNVIFGKTADYAAVADNYDGTLVDVEQDVNVYAYYVPNGSNYDVYFLAPDTIYTPKDSTELFRNMTALQRVDTANLDVSRTEIMFRMFQSCSNLVEMDTSRWDTSRVTDMGRAFQACTILPYLDVSGWDVGNVTNMYCLFGGSEKLNNLDVSEWDTSNVVDMSYMFWHCYSVEALDVDEWDTGNVRDFTDMFAGKHNLFNMGIRELDVTNWDMSSAVTIRDMFYGCGQLTELDLSKWNTSNITDMRHTFADCCNLKSIDFSNWDTSKVKNFDGTFNDCMSLTELDLTSWNTCSAETFAQLFEGCRDLKVIKGIETWDTSNVWECEEMFYSNSRGMSIEVLDLSGWDTSNMVDIVSMFNGCSELKTIYVGDGWDMTQATTHYNVFAGCGSLVGGNGTTTAGNPVDKTYACVDTAETPGYLTHINDRITE